MVTKAFIILSTPYFYVIGRRRDVVVLPGGEFAVVKYKTAAAARGAPVKYAVLFPTLPS